MKTNKEKAMVHHLTIFTVFLSLLFLNGCSAEHQIYTAPIIPETDEESDSQTSTLPNNMILGEKKETAPTPGVEQKIMIQNVGEFKYNPKDINTKRTDIFQEGHFSIFDILVYLDETEQIDMTYHFDENMNTHMLDSIDGESGYWFMSYYDGGWPEDNVFRMDHYPVKDETYIRITKESQRMLDDMYQIFKDEVTRKSENEDKLIIPEVIIRGPTARHRFTDVKVTSHDLRSDALQEGLMTAIDVIMSLGDQGKISYDLQWYESIGRAEVIKSYWVERIDQDKAHNRCGFVYEAGSKKFDGFRGNHIHLPSDMRVLNSPEYVEYFWICI